MILVFLGVAMVVWVPWVFKGPEKATREGWMGANQNSSTELGIYPKINPTRLSSNSTKTA
jgi:hypothetical protein